MRSAPRMSMSRAEPRRRGETDTTRPHRRSASWRPRRAAAIHTRRRRHARRRRSGTRAFLPAPTGPRCRARRRARRRRAPTRTTRTAPRSRRSSGSRRHGLTLPRSPRRRRSTAFRPLVHARAPTAHARRASTTSSRSPIAARSRPMRSGHMCTYRARCTVTSGSARSRPSSSAAG